MLDTLRKLKPVKTCDTLCRIGNDHDGGYILSESALNNHTNVVYSFGVGAESSFELAMAQQGLDCFMYDHTVDKPVIQHDKFHFTKRGIATKDSDNMLSLPSIIKHTDILLQCDIEGAEWEVFANIDKNLLDAFSQILIEFHWVERYINSKILEHAINNITYNFVPIHLHANNYAPLFSIENQPVPSVFEVSLIRKDLVQLATGEIFLPTALDRANNKHKPDYILGNFLSN